MQLVPIVDQKAIEEIFLSKKLQEQVQLIVDDGDNYVADVATKSGRSLCITKAASIVTQKVIVENARKALKSQYKIHIDNIDRAGKTARDSLNAVRDRVRQPVTDWEAEEKKRLQIERDLVELEMDWDEAISENNLFDREAKMAKMEMEMEIKEERAAEAEKEKKEAADLKLREEKIASDAKKWAEEKAAKALEDAQKAKDKAVADKIEAKKQAEIDKAKAVEDAKKAEILRQKNIADKTALDAKNAKEKAEKIAANRNHQKRINREIAKDLLDGLGLPEEQAKMFIVGVLANKIRHLKINY